MSDHENGRTGDPQRWTGKRRAELVLEILSGKVTTAEACQMHSLAPSDVEEWMEEGSRAMENALSALPSHQEEIFQIQVKEPQANVGELISTASEQTNDPPPRFLRISVLFITDRNLAPPKGHPDVVDFGAGCPFGALILQIDDETGKVIRYWLNHNHVTEWIDPTAHAEVTAIRAACKELGVFNLGKIKRDDPSLKLPQTCKTSHCEIYSSAEPCPMCYAAIRWARIDTLVFAATRLDAAAQGVNFSDDSIYTELATPMYLRKDLGMHIYQSPMPNSLDAFNTYK